MEPKEIIKNARDAKGLTQAELAKKIGLSSRMIQRYEEGKFPKYKSEKIKKVDAFLGTSIYDIIYDTSGSPNSSDKSDYVALLKSNDQFFKKEYAQMLISLNRLIDLGMKSEALLKLNLQHTGIIEALQKGADVDEIQEQINSQIAEIGPSEQKGSDDGN